MGTHAAAAAGVDDELHRQELCLGWIYEFFARHRMEEAQEGAWGRASRPHDRAPASSRCCSRACAASARVVPRGHPPPARRGSAGKHPRRPFVPRARARCAPWHARGAAQPATRLRGAALARGLTRRVSRGPGVPCARMPVCARAALIKSAEKKFHVSLASLQRHSDPISIIQQHLEKGEVRLRPRERVCLRPQPARAVGFGVPGVPAARP
jgi:hypothetical protein